MIERDKESFVRTVSPAAARHFFGLPSNAPVRIVTDTVTHQVEAYPKGITYAVWRGPGEPNQ